MPMTPKSSDYGRVFFQAEVFRAGRLAERRPRPSDTIIERARRVPVFRDCDVLVAGGGPAGTAAAIAAARAGAATVLVERHNHLGGLSTGGLVIWIDRPGRKAARTAEILGFSLGMSQSQQNVLQRISAGCKPLQSARCDNLATTLLGH